MVPVWVPLATAVFVVASIAIVIAYPPAAVPIDVILEILRFAPATVAVAVARDAHAMIAIDVATLERASGGDARERYRQRQTQGSGGESRWLWRS
jgi:hypothetical protein